MKVRLIACKDGGIYGEYVNKTLKQIEHFLKERGIEVITGEEDSDLTLIVGGDSTLLNSHLSIRSPFIGVNPLPVYEHKEGSLGFFMQLDGKNMLAGLEKVINEEYYVVGLTRLKVVYPDGLPPALNEVQLFPDPPSDFLKIWLEVEGDEICLRSRELGSFLLVYTPQGSTAFARQVGAWRIDPRANVFGIIMGAGFSGVTRSPLIVDAGSRVRVVFECEGTLSVDSRKRGRRKPLCLIERGEEVVLERGPPLEMVILEPWRYFDVCNLKFFLIFLCSVCRRRVQSVRRVEAIYCVQGAVHFVSGLLGPIYAVFVSKIGGDLFSAGFTYGIYMLSMGVAYIFFGRLEDILDVRALAAFSGLLIQSFCILSYLFVKSPLHLAIVQIFMGVAGAMHVPAMDALMSSATRRNNSAFLWGGLEAVEDLSYGVASIIGGAVAHYFGFEFLFVAMAFISLIASLLVLTLFTKKEWRILRKTLRA